MSETNSTPNEDLNHLRERVQTLAAEKSYLQLVNHLMENLSAASGMEDTASKIIHIILDNIGGANVALYFWVGTHVHYLDVFGEYKVVLDRVDDPLVKLALDRRELVEEPCAFSDTKMLTPEFTDAFNFAQPLLVGDQLVGVIKMEGMILPAVEIRRQFGLIFNYSAMVLKNEVESFSKLMDAYTLLRQANKDLKSAKDGLETRVAERTAELLLSNDQLEIRVAQRTQEFTYANEQLRNEIGERQKAEEARAAAEEQLRQAHKLEAVGQLAAGIAHEINTPTQYVGDNTRFLRDSFQSMATAFKAYSTFLETAQNGPVTPSTIAELKAVLEENDLDYLFEQIPSAIADALEGVNRITKIVSAMKEFSHPGGHEKAPSDLNQAIESTVAVTRNEWKYIAEMRLELDAQLPPVTCFLGEFNQAILNLIVNASHAITDVVKQKPGTMGVITIRTLRDGDTAEVRVSDTGTGIPEKIRPRIFDPFFTTKAIGQGTGQGLSVVYGTIVKRHGGTVTIESEEGKGTTFIIRLPI